MSEPKIETDAALPEDTVFFINTKLTPEEREAVRGMSVEELARWMVENRKLSVITNVGPPES